jgi:AraC-like DNA-binding protein
MAELVFLVRLARLATREAIVPLRVTTDVLPRPTAAYREFFGVHLRSGETHSLRFRHVDALRPFLTANDGMWKAFEPELRRRLADLEGAGTLRERVRAVLLEGLPGGESSIDSVAQRLALGKRTLQRGLSEERASFQEVLRETREALARHYLERTKIAASEISFLLGFVEPSSFYRAFGVWTGRTPEAVRRAAVRTPGF